MRHVPQTFSTVVERPYHLLPIEISNENAKNTNLKYLMEPNDIVSKKIVPLPARNSSIKYKLQNTKLQDNSDTINDGRVARFVREFSFDNSNGIQMFFKIGDLIKILTIFNDNWCMAIKFCSTNLSKNTIHRNDKFFIPLSNIQFCDSLEEIDKVSPIQHDQVIMHLSPNQETSLHSNINSNDNNYNNNNDNNNQILELTDVYNINNKVNNDEDFERRSDEAIGSSRDSLIEDELSISEYISSPITEPIYSTPDQPIIFHTIIPKAMPRRRKTSPEYENLPSQHFQATISRAIQQTQEGATHIRTLADGWAEFMLKSSGQTYLWNSFTGEMKPTPRLSDDVNSVTLPLRKTTGVLSRLPSQKKFPILNDNSAPDIIPHSSTLPLSNSMPTSIETEYNAVCSSDLKTPILNAQNILITNKTGMTTSMTDKHYRSEQSSQQTHSSPFSSKRFNQTSILFEQLFKSHVINGPSSSAQASVSPSISTISRHPAHSSHGTSNEYDCQYNTKTNTLPNEYLNPGSYSTISGTFNSYNYNVETPIQRKTFFNNITPGLSKNRSFKTRSMHINTRAHESLEEKIGPGVSGLTPQMLVNLQNIQQPDKISKLDAIYHGTISIVQRLSNSNIVKLYKGKKTKHGYEMYCVLTKDHLLFSKNEKSAFDSCKFVDYFPLQGSSILWDISYQPHRFDVINFNNKIQLHHSKDDQAKKWFQAIQNTLNSQHKNIEIPSKIPYKHQISQENVGTSTPPTDKKNFKIREKLKQLLRFRPTVETLKQKGIFREEEIFGHSLEELCDRDRDFIPKIVRECVQAIEQKDMEAEGLYRACGNLSNVQKLRFDINSEKYQALYAEEDVHVLTGLLKMFFRNMPEPLFPRANFNALIETITDKCNDDEKIFKFRAILAEFPIKNLETIRFLLAHLLRVIQHSRENRMSIQNLAIVFGPTLLRPNDDKNDLVFDMALQINQCQIVEFLLQNFNSILSTFH